MRSVLQYFYSMHQMVKNVRAKQIRQNELHTLYKMNKACLISDLQLAVCTPKMQELGYSRIGCLNCV